MTRYFIALASIVTLGSCSKNDEGSNQTPASLDFSPVFTFSTDSINLDITSSVVENSIYISYSDQVEIYSEKVLKYNLSNFAQTDLTHYDSSDGVQIEAVGSYIFSLAYNNVNKYDLNLGNTTELSQTFTKSKAARYGNSILLFSGIDYLLPISSNMLVHSYNTFDDSYSEIAEYPNGNRFSGDGITYNDKLYIFGGNDGVSNFSDILIYDLGSDAWSQETLPFTVHESFVSLYNDSVIVAGNKNSDSGEAFIGIYDLSSNAFSEMQTTLDLSNISIRGITVINDEVYVIYTSFASPFVSPITMTVSKASLL